MSTILHCPICDRTLRVPDEFRGQSVQCPHCQSNFTAPAETPAVGEPPPPLEEHVRSEAPPSLELDTFSSLPKAPPPPPEERFQDGPRLERGDVFEPRRRYADDDDDYDYGVERRRGDWERARSAVAGPAIALMIVGGLAAALSIMSLVVGLMLPSASSPASGDAAEEMGRQVGRVFGTIFGICWGGIIFFGAQKMKNLESHGYAMTACIVAMLPCNGCCLLGLPFGIWGLTVLNQPYVKEAFQMNSPQVRRRPPTD